MNKRPIFQIYRYGLALVSLFALLWVSGGPSSLSARSLASPKIHRIETPTPPAAVITAPPARERAPDEMEPLDKIDRNPAGPVEIPLRSVLDEAAITRSTRTSSEVLSPDPVSEVAIESPIPRMVALYSFEGTRQSEAGNYFPPDPHGAVGDLQFVQVTNSHLGVYEKTPPFRRLRSQRLSSFFDYFTQPIFDPRVVYDPQAGRWIVSATAFPESATVQYHFLGISLTADATGSFLIYQFNVNVFGRDDFWDFPQLGMDQGAVIITANVFQRNPSIFRGARMFAVAKDLLYAGEGFTVPLFTGLVGTLAPPIVLDDNPQTFLVAAPPSGSAITKYTLEHSSEGFQATLTSATIRVPEYTVPPLAAQPETEARLETLDGRFANASAQVGDSLWQVHTIAYKDLPRPRYYEFDTVNDTVRQSGLFSASESSYDWNASLTVDASNQHIFANWSSTDPEQGIQAQVRFSGRRECVDPPGYIGPGWALFTSPTYSTRVGNNRYRWGDYSSVTLDPGDPSQAWIVNETNIEPRLWGTRIGIIEMTRLCP